MNTKIFKIYVAVGFGVALLIILIIVLWKNSKKSDLHSRVAPFAGSQRDRAYQRKAHDVEKANMEPLLEQNQDESPPEIPPPDF